jgi:putative NIF3 family GTP cyclohydrolase 1 type 2
LFRSTAVRLREFFDFAIQVGMDADPRGRDTALQDLQDTKLAYSELKEEDRQFFDDDRLANPYADSRILNGDPDHEVKKLLAGIDVDTQELLLADRLNERGAGIDLVLGHHPAGRAYAGFYDVMRMQADILNRFGVPINVAESQLESRMKEVARSVLPANHARPVDAARLLGLAYACIHTPADNLVSTHLQSLFDTEGPTRLKEILRLLKAIPEYEDAAKINAGPRIFIGSDDQRAGKIFVDMTGGTSGSKDTIERLSQSGVGTLVCMHLSEDHRKEAEKNHLRVVIAGHIASDNLGLNLLLDAVGRHGAFDVIACSGFRRVVRQG